MTAANHRLKRVVVGRALRSDRQSEQELPKHLALPIFASDPLSSVTYATQELLVVLTLGGLAYLYLTPYLAAGVVLLLTVVVLSYRQLVQRLPERRRRLRGRVEEPRQAQPAGSSRARCSSTTC